MFNDSIDPTPPFDADHLDDVLHAVKSRVWRRRVVALFPTAIVFGASYLLVTSTVGAPFPSQAPPPEIASAEIVLTNDGTAELANPDGDVAADLSRVDDSVSPGSGGTTLTLDPAKITILDIEPVSDVTEIEPEPEPDPASTAAATESPNNPDTPDGTDEPDSSATSLSTPSAADPLGDQPSAEADVSAPSVDGLIVEPTDDLSLPAAFETASDSNGDGVDTEAAEDTGDNAGADGIDGLDGTVDNPLPDPAGEPLDGDDSDDDATATATTGSDADAGETNNTDVIEIPAPGVPTDGSGATDSDTPPIDAPIVVPAGTGGTIEGDPTAVPSTAPPVITDPTSEPAPPVVNPGVPTGPAAAGIEPTPADPAEPSEPTDSEPSAVDPAEPTEPSDSPTANAPVAVANVPITVEFTSMQISGSTVEIVLAVSDPDGWTIGACGTSMTWGDGSSTGSMCEPECLDSIPDAPAPGVSGELRFTHTYTATSGTVTPTFTIFTGAECFGDRHFGVLNPVLVLTDLGVTLG